MPRKRKNVTDNAEVSRHAKRMRTARSSSRDTRDHSYAVHSSDLSSTTPATAELLSDSSTDRRPLIPSHSHVFQSVLSPGAPSNSLLTVSFLSASSLLPRLPSSTILPISTESPFSRNSSAAAILAEQTSNTARSAERLPHQATQIPCDMVTMVQNRDLPPPLSPSNSEQPAPTANDADTREFATDQVNIVQSLPIQSAEDTAQDVHPPAPIPNERAEVHDVPVPLPNYPAFHYNPRNLYDGARTGSMSATCLHCNAKKWPTEPPGICCANGKVDVPLLGPPPEPLRALLTTNTPPAKEFRNKIRTYNSCFVMTSFQAHTVVEPGFMPTFKVQGQIYHNIGPLTPAAEQQPQFVQVYFIDDRGQQADARLSWQTDRESQLNRDHPSPTRHAPPTQRARSHFENRARSANTRHA